MDTRRAPDSRERVSAPPSTGQPNVPDDTDSQTQVVKLADLDPAGRSGRGRRPPAIVVASVVFAIVGFAIGAALPHAGPVALASPTPLVSASVGASTPSTPSPTPGLPSSPPSTPRPTDPPAWAWSRHPLLPNDSISVNETTGAWGVGPNVITVVARTFPNGTVAGYSIARLSPGRDWQLVDLPPAVDGVYGGTVIDGKLWFVARVSGLADVTWQLVSTTDGSAFESPGPAIGLGALDGISFLGRVGNRWVAAGWLDTDAGEGSGVSFLRSSEDGVLWEDATVPDYAGDVIYRAGASSGAMAVLIAFDGGEAPQDAVALTTRDGMEWERSVFDAPRLDPTVAACDESTCVIAGYQYETEVAPVAWSSSDGHAWAASPTAAQIGVEYRGIDKLVRYDGGFLAASHDGPWAWLSADGMSWRSVAVLPDRGEEPVDQSRIVDLSAVAVAGDLVIAINAPSGDAPPTYWRGSLSAMLAAP